jgi:hypothetical protein
MSKPRRLDAVNHPPHYRAANGMETIDVIESFRLGYHLGNAIKYILRCGHKGPPIEDLEKARWYLWREIGRRQKLERKTKRAARPVAREAAAARRRRKSPRSTSSSPAGTG